MDHFQHDYQQLLGYKSFFLSGKILVCQFDMLLNIDEINNLKSKLTKSP